MDVEGKPKIHPSSMVPLSNGTKETKSWGWRLIKILGWKMRKRMGPLLWISWKTSILPKVVAEMIVLEAI